MTESDKYYVYGIFDPLSHTPESPVYIGKGTLGKGSGYRPLRMREHLVGRSSNERLKALQRERAAVGVGMVGTIMGCYDTEEEAYFQEWLLIAIHRPCREDGRRVFCNVSEGRFVSKRTLDRARQRVSEEIHPDLVDLV